MGAAWRVDAILRVITKATFKDRDCCDGREICRQADDSAPCLSAKQLSPAQIIQTYAGRLPC
jgi:hypothetical protein